MKSFISIFIILFSGIAHGQTLHHAKLSDSLYSIEEINVTGNRIHTTIFNSPTFVQVLDRQDIENANGENLADILKTASGIHIKSYGSNSSLSTISMNGLGSEHTLVLVNGVKINSPLNAQVDLSLIPKENIERIEVLNNGASAIYGAEAMGGVLNIITKKTGLNTYPEVSLSSTLGSYNFRKHLLNSNASFGDLSLRVIASMEDADNNFDYIFTSGNNITTKQRTNSEYSIRNFYIDASYRLNNKSSLKLFSNYTDERRGLPGIETGTPSSISVQKDRNWNNMMSFVSDLSKNVSFRTDASFRNDLQNYTTAPYTDSYYKNYVLSNSSQVNFVKKDLQIAGGYELSYLTLQSNEHEEIVNRTQASAFVTTEYNVTEGLKIFPSARFEHISDISKSFAAVKFGVNYKPFSKHNFHLRSSIGNNFHAPTFNELYWHNLGNLNLQPETSLNFDAGMIYGFRLFADVLANINYTRIDAKDKIVWRPGAGGLYSPVNIGSSLSDIITAGIEFSGEMSKDLMYTAGFSYTYNNSVKTNEDYTGDPSLNKQMYYIPLELAKGQLNVTYKILSLNFFYNFLGKRYTDFENQRFLPAVDLFDGNLSASFPVWKVILETRIEVNNIFDTDYQVQAGYPTPLRNYKFGLSIKY